MSTRIKCLNFLLVFLLTFGTTSGVFAEGNTPSSTEDKTTTEEISNTNEQGSSSIKDNESTENKDNNGDTSPVKDVEPNENKENNGDTPSAKGNESTENKENNKDTSSVKDNEYTENKEKNEDISQTDENDYSDVDLIDKRNEVYQGSMKIRVFLGSSTYLPKGTLVFEDKNGVFGRIPLSMSTYDAGSNSFVFEVKPKQGYKVGDKFKIYLDSEDPLLKGVGYVSYGEDGSQHEKISYTKTKNKIEIGVTESEYMNDDETKVIKWVYPNDFQELVLHAVFHTDVTAILVKDLKGNSLRGVSFNVHVSDKVVKKVTTDNNGYLLLNKNLSGEEIVLEVINKGYKFLNNDTMYILGNYDYGIEDGANVVILKLKTPLDNAKKGLYDVKVSLKSLADSSISKSWMNGYIVFDNGKQKFSYDIVNGNLPKVSLLEGKYSVKVFSNDAIISTDKNSIVVDSKGEPSLTIILKPKVLLKIADKDGNYNFVINGKSFKGNKELSFGVNYGDVFLVKDLKRNKVYSVMIEQGSDVTKLVLGEGVVFGGNVTTPHTGDGILFLILLLVFSLIGYGVVEMYRRGTLKKVINMLFVGLLLSGSFVGYVGNNKVYAESDEIIGGATIGSGTPAKPSHGNTTPDGAVQASHNRNTVLMVGFTNGNYSIKDSDGNVKTISDLSVKSDISDFEKTPILNPKMLRNAFFMAVNQDDYNVFSKDSTSFAVYDSGGLKHIWGKQPFLSDENDSAYYRKKYKIQCDPTVVKKCNNPSSRLMPLPEDAIKSENEFVRFVGLVVKNLDASNLSNRKLWSSIGHDSSSKNSIGDAITKAYIDTLFKDLAKENNETVEAYYTKVLNGYIQYLNYIGQDDVAMAIQNDIDTKKNLIKAGVENTGINYVFFFQVVPSFYVKGDQSKFMFMPLHDATLWFKAGRINAGGSRSKYYRSLHEKHQAKVIYGNKLDKGCPRNSGWAWVSPCHTFLGYARDSYGFAIKPKSENVPILKPTDTELSLEKNPFAGWGFVNWWDKGGFKTSEYPKILIKYDITTEDGRNIVVDDPNYGLDDKENSLSEIIGMVFPRISRSATISFNGEMFKLLDKDLKYYALDYAYYKNLKGNYDSIPDRYNLINVDGVNRNNTNILLDSKNNELKITFKAGFNNGMLPSPHDLGKVLGGDPVIFKSPLPSRYSGKEFSHVLVIIKAKAQAVSTKAKSKLNVPEWAISRYFDDIVDGDTSYSTFGVTFNKMTGLNATLTPSGVMSFNPRHTNVDVLTKEKWIYKTSPIFYNDVAERNVDVVNTSHMFGVAGDLLVVRHKDLANPVYLASWLGVTKLFNESVIASSVGKMVGTDRVIKTATLKYVAKAPSDTFTYSETRYSSSTFYDHDGKPYSVSTPYTHTENAVTSYKDAEYNIEVQFDKHKTSDRKVSNVVTPLDTKRNAYKEEIYVENGELKVYPEIFMMYDGYKSKGSGGAFVIGERVRRIKPPVMNVADFVQTDIKPKVTGMTPATDTRAKQLAQKMGRSDLGVIYKGSAVTVNFETEGKVRFRTYALDIGNTALKNAWGNSNYSTDAIRDKFLSKFGSKDSNGKWLIEAKASGKLVIDGKEYGGGLRSGIKLKELNSKVNTYQLEIRGGKLYSVNGVVNYMSAPDHIIPNEVKDVLNKLKIAGNYGSNIFGSFARNEGDILTDNDFVRLSQLYRGMTGDVALGKGWYNEDSTVLVLREYVTEFEVPKFAYTDKIPMEIQGLQTPIDKSQYFSLGKFGYVRLYIDLGNDFALDYNSYEQTPVVGKHEKLYIVPNVSVMDTFGQ